MKLKTKHFTKSPRIQFEKMKDPKLAEVFQAKVIGKFAALGIFDSDIDTLVHSLKDEQLATAEGVLGRQRTKIQPWVTNEVFDLSDQREQLKQKYTSTEAGLEYRKVKRDVRKKMKATQKERSEEQCKSIAKGMMLLTIPSRLSPRANSISQQSSKTAAKTS